MKNIQNPKSEEIYCIVLYSRVLLALVNYNNVSSKYNFCGGNK